MQLLARLNKWGRDQPYREVNRPMIQPLAALAALEVVLLTPLQGHACENLEALELVAL